MSAGAREQEEEAEKNGTTRGEGEGYVRSCVQAFTCFHVLLRQCLVLIFSLLGMHGEHNCFGNQSLAFSRSPQSLGSWILARA